MTSVTIPNSVTSIGNQAFASCSGLIDVTIPNSVTNLGVYGFIGCSGLTSVTIPSSVTSIGRGAFSSCTSLTEITVDTLNLSYSSAGGVLFDKNQTTLIECPMGKAESYTILNSVTNIGDEAFSNCNSLTSITIGNSVTSIGDSAFSYCTSLRELYFKGNAPSLNSSVLDDDDMVTIFYLPETAGWGATFSDRPTTLWVLPNPLILNNGSGFGMKIDGFGFIISWPSNVSVVVEACTALANPNWSAVATNTLTGDLSYFSDPQSTNYASRFYRLRSP